MALVLRVDSDENIAFANKLEKIHRSALPSAIRNTLNQAALMVKKETLLESAKSNFKERQPNFFKANSKVDFAKGFNVNSMESVVGMFSNKLKGEDNYAVKNLEQQEEGGQIEGRSFIPMKQARISGWKVTKPKFRMAQMNNVVDVNKVRAKNKKQKYIKAAFKAKSLFGDAAFILGNPWKGNRTLSKIDDVSTGPLLIKRTPLYTFRKGRKITVSGTNFMKRASLEVGMNIDHIFVVNAIKQIKRLNL